MSVPSLVSIINRGPISGLASTGGFAAGRGAALLLPALLLAATDLLSGSEPSAGFSFVVATGLLSSFASSVGFFAAPVGEKSRITSFGDQSEN